MANKAYIKELSSEEVVLFDGEEIVAGMTSGRNLTNSELPSDTKKGDVRIWAGEMQNAGDLTSAYTTISNNGSIKLQNIEKGKYIYLDPENCNFKISGPTTI